MNKLYFLLFFFLPISLMAQQNLISNPSFEERRGVCPATPNQLLMSLSIDTITQQGNYCVLKDWMQLYQSPDAYSIHDISNSYPQNSYSRYIYPHSDSTFIGMGFFNLATFQNIDRELIQGKLTDSLITGHHYLFSMYVQLGDRALALE